MFRFFAKVKLNGESKFRFVSSGGSVNNLKIHAVHLPEIEGFLKIEDSIRKFGQVAEYRVFENVEGLKHPRLVHSVTF